MKTKSTEKRAICYGSCLKIREKIGCRRGIRPYKNYLKKRKESSSGRALRKASTHMLIHVAIGVVACSYNIERFKSPESYKEKLGEFALEI